MGTPVTAVQRLVVGAIALTVVACSGGAPAPTTPQPAAKAAATAPASGSGAAAPVASPTGRSQAPVASSSPMAAASTKPAAPAAPAPSAAPPKEFRKTTFVIGNLSFYAVPVVLAKEKGYFRDEGIDLEITATGSGSRATAALAGGSADFGSMEFSDMLAAVAQRQPLLGFAAFVTEPTVSIAMKHSVARERKLTEQSSLGEKIKAFRGLKIAITTPGSGTDAALRWLLLNAGLEPERDVQIVPAGSAANSLAAFSQGQVDVLTQTSPWVETAVAKHDGIMIVSFPRGDVPEQKGRLTFSLVGRRETMDRNPEVMTSATRALWRALRFINEQSGEAKKLVKDLLFREIEPDVYDLAWRLNAPSYPKDPRMSERHVQLNVDFKSRVTGEKLNIPFDHAATNRFVDEVAKTLR